MTKIVGELDLSQIPETEYKPELELRVAVVREDGILDSTGSLLTWVECRRRSRRASARSSAPMTAATEISSPPRASLTHAAAETSRWCSMT